MGHGDRAAPSDNDLVGLVSVPMDISCAFATSMATPDQIAEAERLGYIRA